MSSTTKLKNLVVKMHMPFINIFKIFMYYGLPSRLSRPTAIDVLEQKALESSALYIESVGSNAMIFRSRMDLWTFALTQVSIKGIFIEFGVSWGKSINYFAERLPKNLKIYGFDSFQGLKENFTGTGFSTGAFSTGKNLPNVKNNVVLVKGWFKDTLPLFLMQNNDFFSFIHLDADTYVSTKEVLDLVQDRIKSGTIVVFDEYLGNPNWVNHEYKAWKEFVFKFNISYDYIAFSPQSAVIRVI